MFSNYKSVINFRPLEVVGRGSETQLQIGKNLNYLILRFKPSQCIKASFYITENRLIFLQPRVLEGNYPSKHNTLSR